MDSDAIYASLTQVFHDVFDDDTIAVTSELNADAVDEWDSLSHIRLIVAVEKKFGLKFSAAEVRKLANVGEFVALIQSRTGG
jgi:acyl carrier protein